MKVIKRLVALLLMIPLAIFSVIEFLFTGDENLTDKFGRAIGDWIHE